MKIIKNLLKIKKINMISVKQNRKSFSFILFAIVILSCNIILPQSVGRVGTTAASFLKIGIGGRALGMGEAYTTLAEDVTGTYWNPAGIANINRIEASINHYSYIAEIYYDYGAIAIPLQDIGTFGIFLANLGMPDIERTTIQYPEGTGEKVSANSFVMGLTYARALTDRFSIGGSAKYIRETIFHSSASGFAFDIGVLYRAFFKNVKIGMSISNFGTEMQMDGRDMLVQHDIDQTFEGNNPNINSYLNTDKFPLPIIFRFGISANVAKDFIGLNDYDWIISADAIHPNDSKEFVNAGSELRFFNIFSLRGGYRQLLLQDREGGLTFGFGVQYKIMDVNIKFDYANVDYGRLDTHNKYSLTLSF